MPESLGELGTALIRLKIERQQLQQELQQAKQIVQRHAEDAGGEGDGGGLMGRYMFGRRGPGGVGESVEHALGHAAFGRMFRMFAAGGALGVGIGMVAHSIVELGESLLSNALGWEKSAEAAEKHKEAVEAAAKAYETLKDAQRGAFELRPSTAVAATSVVHETLHPTGGAARFESTIKDREEQIKKEREVADKFLTEDRVKNPHARIMSEAERHGREHPGDLQHLTAHEAAIRRQGRQRFIDSPAYQASIHASTADDLQKQQSIDMGMFGALRRGSELFNQGTGALFSAGSRAASQLGAGALGIAERAAPGLGRENVRAKYGEEMINENKRFSRQQAAEAEERQFRPMSGATDVSQIGQQIQNVILQPSAKDREEREHRRKIEQISEEMRDALRKLDPANQVRGRQLAIAATVVHGP